MPSIIKNSKVDRILDANLNRLKEGLRVCEEITRFVFEDKKLTEEFKKIRHRIDSSFKRTSREELLYARKSENDVGKNIFANELKRKGIRDIYFANIQRVKESLRVLEEFSKLKSIACARKLKNIRYHIYGLERKIHESSCISK